MGPLAFPKPVGRVVVGQTQSNGKEGVRGSSLAIQLADRMVDAATVVFVPGYMEPVFRFLRGTGELRSRPDGSAFTLWEKLLHLSDGDYPLWVGGRTFTQDDLLLQASQALAGDQEIGIDRVGEDGMQRVRAMLVERGFDTGVP